MEDLKSLKEIAKDYSILYVEDDVDARTQVLDILEMIFKEVFVAGDGVEGLDLFKKHSSKVDLVLTDVQMPNMDGLKMTEAIKEIDSSKHILILSAHNDIAYFSKAIDIGVDGFIIKPIVAKKLFTSLKKAIYLINSQKLERSYHDEIERRLIERSLELENSLVTDDITGLHNKTKLSIDLLSNTHCAILLINLDNFDHINSTYGYDFGDKLLKEIALFLRSIKEVVGVPLYRLASDEMVFLFLESSADHIEKFAGSINKKLDSHVFDIEDVDVRVTCTIGIAEGKGRQVLVDAHIAMKEIREIGKNRYHTYSTTSKLQVKQKSNIEWFKKVRYALENNLVTPYYQPIIDNKTNKIHKYEALARIVDMNRIITPNYFIDPARLVGMLPNITKVMIRKSFEELKDRDVEFSLNITENDLKEGYLIEYLQKELVNSNINPNRVVLEILENISAQGSKDALEQLKELKSMGFKLAIDDFGSERSNFYRLQELNVDFIKIDGSFIKDINTNKNCYQIAKTITTMAKNLGAKVIAEFVCDKSVYERVLELDIDYSQGYYFGKPALLSSKGDEDEQR